MAVSCSRFLLYLKDNCQAIPLTRPALHMLWCLEWGTALWESKSVVLDSFATFVCELRKVFDPPVGCPKAANRLIALSQGSQSAASYSIDLCILAAESGWNEWALFSIFVWWWPAGQAIHLWPPWVPRIFFLSICVDNAPAPRSELHSSPERLTLRLAMDFETPLLHRRNPCS